MASLIIDFKIDKLIKHIQENHTDAKGNKLEYETIVKVLEAQLNSTLHGMLHGHTVVWKYFGTFSATKRRVDALNNKYKKAGKTPTLVDNGMIRMSFKRTGEQIGKTDLLFPQSKKDILEVPDKYLNKEDNDRQ